MARIPLGNFGNVRPQNTNAQASGAGAPYQAVAQVLGAGANLAGANYTNQLREQNIVDQIQERDERLKFVGISSKTAADISLLDDDLTTKVNAGELNLEQSIQQRQDGVKAIKERYAADVPQRFQKNFEQWADVTAYESSSKLAPVVQQMKQKENLLAVDETIDNALKVGDKAQFMALTTQALEASGLPSNIKQQRLLEAQTRWDKNSASTELIALSDAGDIEGINQKFSKEELIKNYPNLSAENILQFQESAGREADRITRAKEVEEAKRINLAGQVFNDFKSAVLTGRALTPELQENTLAAVRGTEYEAEFQFYQQQSKNFGKFQNMSTSAQLAEINAIKANLKNSKSSDPQTEEKILGVYENIYSEKLNTIRNDPSQAVREAGVRVQPVTAVQMVANPRAAAASIVENGISQMSLKDANVSLKPIPAENLPEAKQAWNKLGVDGKLNMISEMIRGTRNVSNGPKIWGSALGQLADGDLSYVMAGVARMNGYRSQKGEDVATAIVSGTQLLKNKQFVMPKEDDMRKEFNKYVGGAVTGTDANTMYSAFKSLYASSLSTQGLTHEAKDEKPISSVLNTALSLATGGMYTQGDFTNYVGGKIEDWKVSKPYGMSDDRFEAHIEGMYKGLAKANNVRESDLKTLRLRRAGVNPRNGAIVYDLIDERGIPKYRGTMPKGVDK